MTEQQLMMLGNCAEFEAETLELSMMKIDHKIDSLNADKKAIVSHVDDLTLLPASIDPHLFTTQQNHLSHQYELITEIDKKIAAFEEEKTDLKQQHLGCKVTQKSYERMLEKHLKAQDVTLQKKSWQNIEDSYQFKGQKTNHDKY
ncbi:MAG: hypothetical protein ACO2ZM_08970 [Francisellaceae bacterium]